MSASKRRSVLVCLGILFAASSALAEQAAPGSKPQAQAHKDRVFRPDRPGKGTQPSMALPKMPRPAAKVTTWGVSETYQQVFSPARRDPYSVEVGGVLENSKIKVEQQAKSADLQIPNNKLSADGKARLRKIYRRLAADGTWHRMGRQERRALINKVVRQDRSKQWQSAVARAQQYQPLLEMSATGLNPSTANRVERPEVLATHTPIRITGKDQFGRQIATMYTKAAGLETKNEPISQYHSYYGTIGGTRTTGGTLVTPRTPEVNTNNLFITPAYGARGAEEVKLLGLAAFDQAVQIKVTNTRTGEVSTLYPEKKSGLASNSGTQGLVVKALQGDKLQVTVTHLGEANKSQQSDKSFNVRVPVLSGPAKDKGLQPAFTKRDVRYYHVNVVE